MIMCDPCDEVGGVKKDSLVYKHIEEDGKIVDLPELYMLGCSIFGATFRKSLRDIPDGLKEKYIKIKVQSNNKHFYDYLTSKNGKCFIELYGEPLKEFMEGVIFPEEKGSF